MQKPAFLLTTVAVVGLALASSWRFGGAVMAHIVDHQPSSKALWAYRTDNAAKMARDVDAVVVARFSGATLGRTATSSNGESTLQFELNEFVVEEAIKGTRPGDSLIVERVSGESEKQVIFDHDGGPYGEGESYLLFLRRQPGSDVYYLVNDEGRYSITADDRLRPVGEGKVAARLSGTSVAEARSFLVRALRGAPTP